jgi:T-complex protein 1 subunit delta
MSNENKQEREKQSDVRQSNISAAKALADCVRTSLGPRGMDKMIVDGRGEVTVSNDGATILNKFDVTHPCAKMLVDLSRAQDVEAGDGTTSVVVLCGSMLRACEELLHRGIHATQISEAFQQSVIEATKIVNAMSIPVDITAGKEPLVKAAITSLNSKVVSQNSALLAPMAVDAVRAVMKPNGDVDMRDIRVSTALGGTVEDTEFLTNGLIFKQKASSSAGGPTRIANANIALIQFQLSPPKTDMESTVVVSDYTQIDRVMKEERKYLLDICKKIQESGCNVLLVQKSILRDAVTALSLDILAKMKIMVVKDIERNDVPFICKCLGLLPVANIENLKAEKFGKAELVAQESTGDGRVVRISGVITKPGAVVSKTASVFVRGGNQLMVAEADRSFHDALCVVRSIAKKNALIVGGAAAEIEIALKLGTRAREIGGITGYCMRAYADAFEIIPYTLAENAGLNPISIVTELRNAHNAGKATYGINVRKGTVTDMNEENVVQPLLVTLSALRLATECVCMILKIDDIVLTR